MWSAFITGMAEKATSLIDERDKEIQEKIDRQLEKMYKDAAETKKKAELRRDSLESTARELMSLGVSETQAASLLQNVGPEGASNMVERLKKAKQVTPEKIRAAMAQIETSQAPLTDIIAQQTTPTAREVQEPQMRGAFGLPSRAGREFAETARGIETELPEVPTKAQPLDLSVLEEEEAAPTKAEVLASYAKKINDASDDPKEVSRLQRERDLYINRGFPKDEDKEKALTFSNTTTGLQKAISQAYTANSQKLGNSTFSIADDGTIRFAPGTAQHAQFFRDLVRNTIQDTTERYTDAEGRLPEPIAAAVNFMGTAYGIRVGRDRKIVVGGAEPPTSPATPPAVSPASAPPPKGATTATKPSLEQFMIRARQANPGASDAELKKYYEDKYGNK